MSIVSCRIKADTRKDMLSPGSVNKQQPKTPAHPGASSPPVATLHVAPVPVMPQPRVYHYQNTATGEHLASLLPPDHPDMLCLQQGGHVPHTKFGILGKCCSLSLCASTHLVLGVLAAIVWFPLGIGLCLLDRRVHCKRCGAVIDQGMCG